MKVLLLVLLSNWIHVKAFNLSRSHIPFVGMKQVLSDRNSMTRNHGLAASGINGSRAVIALSNSNISLTSTYLQCKNSNTIILNHYFQLISLMSSNLCLK